MASVHTGTTRAVAAAPGCGLQLHHRHPYGYGGDHSVDNVALPCRAHNRFLAEIDYSSRGGGTRGGGS